VAAALSETAAALSETNAAASAVAAAASEVAAAASEVAAAASAVAADASATLATAIADSISKSSLGFRNGDFLINQRGFTFTHSTFGYTSDGWVFDPILDGGTISGNSAATNPFTLGQVDVPGNPVNYYSFAGNITGGGGNEVLGIKSFILDVSAYATEQVTVSFWVKGSIPGDITTNFIQYFGSGGTPDASVQVYADNVSVTTSWQRITRTVTLPTVFGKNLGSNNDDRLRMGILSQVGATWSATIGSPAPVNYTGVLDVSDLQIDAGPIATPYRRQEVSAAMGESQRWYQRLDIGGNSPRLFRGGLFDASAASDHFVHSVAMRGAPTTTLLNGISVDFDALNGGMVAANAIPTASSNGQTWALIAITTASNGFAYQGNWGGFTEKVEFSSEF
jgi:hypothetical protein